MILEIWEDKEKGLYKGYIIKDFDRLDIYDGKFYLKMKIGLMSGSLDKLKTFVDDWDKVIV